MEPIVIEGVPSSVIEEGMNQWFKNSFSTTIPIIKDVETPAETLVETLAETTIVHNLRNPPYPKRLVLGLGIVGNNSCRILPKYGEEHEGEDEGATTEEAT